MNLEDTFVSVLSRFFIKMVEIQDISDSFFEIYEGIVDTSNIISFDDKIAALEKIYRKFYPSVLVQRLENYGPDFFDYYTDSAKGKLDKYIHKSLLKPPQKFSENFRSFPWMVKPEAMHFKDKIRDYIIENCGKILEEGLISFDSETIGGLYGFEMSYPTLSNILTQKSNMNDEVIFSFILRIASLVGMPSYVFISSFNLFPEEIPLYRENHKRNILKEIIFPGFESLGFYDPKTWKDLKGFDPVRWFEEDSVWIRESYNGLHAPAFKEELDHHLYLFEKLLNRS